MEEGFCSVETMIRQRYFPWLKIFQEKLLKNFSNDYFEDALHYLLENVNTEVKGFSVNKNKKREKALFETICDLFLHFWWKMHWKDIKLWRKYWKKDTFDVYSHDVPTKFYAKLLHYIIFLGISLSRGNPDSQWISRTLQAIKFLPDCDTIVLDALLMIRKIKKKYCDTYCAILRHILKTKIVKCITEPGVYMKIMMLFRKLKSHMKEGFEKIVLLSAASKFQAPSSLLSWLSSLNLEIHKFKQENLTQHLLFKKSSRNLFKKLRQIIVDSECLETKGNISSKIKKQNGSHFDRKMYKASNSVIVKESAKISQDAKSISEKSLSQNNEISNRKKRNCVKNSEKRQLDTKQHNISDSLKIQASSLGLNTACYEIGLESQQIDKEDEMPNLSNSNQPETENDIDLEDRNIARVTSSKNKSQQSQQCKFTMENESKQIKFDQNINSVESSQHINLNTIHLETSVGFNESISSLNLNNVPYVTMFQDSMVINSNFSPNKKSRLSNNRTSPVTSNGIHLSSENFLANDENNSETTSFLEEIGSSNKCVSHPNSLLNASTNTVNCNDYHSTEILANSDSIPDNVNSKSPELNENPVLPSNSISELLNHNNLVSLVDITNSCPTEAINALFGTNSFETHLTVPNCLNKDSNESNTVYNETVNSNSNLHVMNELSPHAQCSLNANNETHINTEINGVNICDKNKFPAKSFQNNYESSTQHFNQHCDFEAGAVLSSNDSAVLPITHQSKYDNTNSENQSLQALTLVGGENYISSDVTNEKCTRDINSQRVNENEHVLKERNGELKGNVNTNSSGGNTSTFVINCKVINESNISCSNSNDIDTSSIKLIINLNSKRFDDGMQPSNQVTFENAAFHRSNILNTTECLNSCHGFSVPLQTSPQVHENNLICKNTPTFGDFGALQPEMGIGFFSPQKSFQNPFGRPGHFVPSPQDNSHHEYLFHTSHTSNCQCESAVCKSSFSSPGGNYSTANGPPGAVLYHSNGQTNGPNHISNSYTPNGLSDSFRSLNKNDLENHVASPKNNLCESNSHRNSRNSIYSDVSEGDTSVSTMSVLSTEETDEPLIRSKDYDTTQNLKDSTINVNAGNKKRKSETEEVMENVSKSSVNTSCRSVSKRKAVIRKCPENTERKVESRYNLRSRERIIKPAKFSDTISKNCF